MLGKEVYCVWGVYLSLAFFFSSRRRHTRCSRDWSSDVCSSDLFDRYHSFGNRSDREDCRLRRSDNRAKRVHLVHSQRSEEHTSELQSRLHLVCRLLLEKKKKQKQNMLE